MKTELNPAKNVLLAIFLPLFVGVFTFYMFALRDIRVATYSSETWMILAAKTCAEANFCKGERFYYILRSIHDSAQSVDDPSLPKRDWPEGSVLSKSEDVKFVYIYNHRIKELIASERKNRER